MTRKTKLAVLTVVIGAGAVLALRSRASGRETAAAADPVLPVVAPGIIEPEADQVALGFELSGRVVEVTVDEGDAVTAGQVVARLDDRIARAEVAKAEAALAVAKAKRDLAMRGARSAEIRAAEADVLAARAQAWERESASGRAQAVRDSNESAISAAQIDAERGAADAARARASAAEARWDLVKQGSRSEEKRAAIAAVDAAEADLAHAMAILSKTELRAPRAGVVLRRFVEAGEQVTTMPPVTVLTIADTSQLELRAEIDESDIARIAVGQRGFATAQAFGDRKFPGQIVRISRELGRKTVRTDDPRARIDTRILEIEFALDDAAGLPLGLRMDVRLDPAAAPAATPQ